MLDFCAYLLNGNILKNQIQKGILQQGALGKKISTGRVFVESKGSRIFREDEKYGFYLYIMTVGEMTGCPVVQLQEVEKGKM